MRSKLAPPCHRSITRAGCSPEIQLYGLVPRLVIHCSAMRNRSEKTSGKADPNAGAALSKGLESAASRVQRLAGPRPHPPDVSVRGNAGRFSFIPRYVWRLCIDAAFLKLAGVGTFSWAFALAARGDPTQLNDVGLLVGGSRAAAHVHLQADLAGQDLNNRCI